MADDVNSILPASVTVVFPRTDHGLHTDTSVHYGSKYAITVTLGSLELDGVGNSGGILDCTKYFHASVAATFAAGGMTPTNNAALESLANQIATDYYGFMLGLADIRLSGFQSWIPGGLDDVIEWEQIGERCSTRACRGPWLDQTEELNYYATGTLAADWVRPACWIQLTATDNKGNYSWSEGYYSNGWTTRTGGLSGVYNGTWPARAIDGNPSYVVGATNGTIVWAQLADDGLTWEFDGSRFFWAKVTSGNGPLPGSGLTITLTTSSGVVSGVAINAAGSGYPVSLTFAVGISGGTGAVANVTTDSSGVPTSVAILTITGGTGYPNGVVSTYAYNSSSGTGTGLTLTLTTSGGAVTGVAISTAGTGYPVSSTFPVLISGTSGTKAVANVTTDSSGVPTSVTLATVVGGSGYSNGSAATVILPHYAWSEAQPTSESTFTIPSVGRYGTVALNPLYEANGFSVSINSYVLIQPAYSDSKYGLVYVTTPTPLPPRPVIEPTLTANYTIPDSTPTDALFPVDATAGNITVTFQRASTAGSGYRISFVRIDATTNLVAVGTNVDIVQISETRGGYLSLSKYGWATFEVTLSGTWSLMSRTGLSVQELRPTLPATGYYEGNTLLIFDKATGVTAAPPALGLFPVPQAGSGNGVLVQGVEAQKLQAGIVTNNIQTWYGQKYLTADIVANRFFCYNSSEVGNFPTPSPSAPYFQISHISYSSSFRGYNAGQYLELLLYFSNTPGDNPIFVFNSSVTSGGDPVYPGIRLGSGDVALDGQNGAFAGLQFTSGWLTGGSFDPGGVTGTFGG